MTVDECVKLLEELVPSECTDTYAYNGYPYLVKGKVDREEVQNICDLDRSELIALLAVAKDCLVFNGWIKGEHAARTVLARLK